MWIIIENLIIVSVFAAALRYLILRFWPTKNNTNSSCSSCSSGCNIPSFEAPVENPKHG